MQTAKLTKRFEAIQCFGMLQLAACRSCRDLVCHAAATAVDGAALRKLTAQLAALPSAGAQRAQRQRSRRERQASAMDERLQVRLCRPQALGCFCLRLATGLWRCVRKALSRLSVAGWSAIRQRQTCAWVPLARDAPSDPRWQNSLPNTRCRMLRRQPSTHRRIGRGGRFVYGIRGTANVEVEDFIDG